MKRKKQKHQPRPPSAPGPVTNRRKANQPLPARARSRFLERGPAAACPDDVLDNLDELLDAPGLSDSDA